MQNCFFLGYVLRPLHKNPMNKEICSDDVNVNIGLYYKDWKWRGTLQSYYANFEIHTNFSRSSFCTPIQSKYYNAKSIFLASQLPFHIISNGNWIIGSNK